jgi:hypothetical protein
MFIYRDKNIKGGWLSAYAKVTAIQNADFGYGSYIFL